MNGEMMLYIDQWGGFHWARSVADLANKLGMSRGTPRRMFQDRPSGVVHVGYVVGRYWCTAYRPYAEPV